MRIKTTKIEINIFINMGRTFETHGLYMDTYIYITQWQDSTSNDMSEN